MIIDLKSPGEPLKPTQGLMLVVSAYDFILWGPETFLVRSWSLTTLRDARFRILATMPQQVRYQHKGDWQ